MWSVEGLYHALILKTEDRDKGRGHDCRLLVALLIYLVINIKVNQSWEPGVLRSGESTHQSHQVNVTRVSNPDMSAIMWAEFVVGSLPCSEWFSPGTPSFPSLQKQTLPNSNSIWNLCTDKFKTSFYELLLCTCKCFMYKQITLQGCCCEVVMSAFGYLKLKLEVQVLWLMVIHVHLPYSLIRWHSLAVVQHPSVAQHF